MLAASADAAAARAISLAEAIETALQRNPDLAIGMREVERAHGLMRSARGAAIPTLSGNVTYTRLDDERAVGGNRLAAENQLNANLMLSAPLLAPQRWMGLRQSKDNERVAQLDVAAVRRSVAVTVAHAYLTVLAMHRTIEAQERALANARAHYDYTHARYEGEIGSELDDVRAAQEVATTEAQLSSARARLVQAQEALGVVVGVEGGLDAAEPDALAVDSDAARTSGLPAPNSAEAADLVAQRSDVVAQAGRERAAQRVVNSRWADYAPTLNGTFMPFFQDPPTVQFPRWGWQAQLILSVPLFDGSVREGQAAQREALLAESRTQLAARLRGARSEVRVAAAALTQADASVQSTQRAAELAQRALAMANIAYEAGATSDIEVIDAERRARDAETAAVVAEDTARRARVDLLAALGKFP
ncbi:MAG TPA: TolC family protein [Polyangiales bacterium]